MIAYSINCVDFNDFRSIDPQNIICGDSLFDRRFVLSVSRRSSIELPGNRLCLKHTNSVVRSIVSIQIWKKKTAWMLSCVIFYCIYKYVNSSNMFLL